MNFEIQFDQEVDGRWIVAIPELPGVIVYGETPLQIEIKAKALALRVLADRMENNKHDHGRRASWATRSCLRFSRASGSGGRRRGEG